MHRIRFTAPNDRPDFRQVAVFLWREGQNYDSDGDSFNPASREWTELYLSNREKHGEWLEIGPDESSATDENEVPQHNALRMQVRSEHLELAARTAFYLAICTGGEVAVGDGREFSPPSSLLPLLGKDFNPDDALTRASNCAFDRSSPDNPYPHLE